MIWTLKIKKKNFLFFLLICVYATQFFWETFSFARAAGLLVRLNVNQPDIKNSLQVHLT